MKVVSAIKKLCPHCYIVRRKKHLYLRCKVHPRHKRRQGGFSTLNYIAEPEMIATNASVRSYDGYRMDTPTTDA